MKTRKSFKILTLIFLIISMSFTALAHPGRTDVNGGHYNKKTGEYHYHNSGSSSDDLADENEAKEVYAKKVNVSNIPDIMNVGETVKLEGTVYPQDASDSKIFWQSSDTSVASINSDGILTAVGAGTAVIYARTRRGTTYSKNIIIHKGVEDNTTDEQHKSDIIVSLQIDNPMMEINGVKTEIDVGRGTKPVVINGRTLVPIRAIIEAFGGSVGWEESSQTVLLTLEDDIIKLGINRTVAYLNDTEETLDVAPIVIGQRTMLPIRFVAEGFNLGVAWENDTKTVSIIRNSFDVNEYNSLMSVLPAYSGQAYTHINNNMPFFKDYEIINGSFEYYSKLDELGRCDVCFASIAPDLMPTEERESISSIMPTGWINVIYDNVNGGYLYNRCHLIGFQLTGENDNERNLITGTRYLNTYGMLPFENLIADYIEETGNRVMYRSTPVFSGNNLVADGVLLEAYSVEDNGQGICFCVYCYNVQPQIIIDYLTGASSFDGE